MVRYPARNCALFLDVDGTLIEIAPTPDSVRVPEGLATLLATITTRLDGALAIVTGRPIRDVDDFLSPLQPIAAGIHGAEMRIVPSGPVTLMAEPIDEDVVAAVEALALRHPGVIIERKRASIAVHHRLAPGAEVAIGQGLEAILADGPDHLILCPGRKVLEIVPRQVSKGTALASLLTLPPFVGRQPVMIGDDISDLSAFAAAEAAGGFGLKVRGERFGAAVADFAGPTEVRDWLVELGRRHQP